LVLGQAPPPPSRHACRKTQQAAKLPQPQQLSSGSGLVAWLADCRRLLASGQEFEALTRPGPSSGGLARCYIKRRKALLGGGHSFQLFLEEGDLYLMSALRWAALAGWSAVAGRRPPRHGCCWDVPV
jgi:hypothetical protein